MSKDKPNLNLFQRIALESLWIICRGFAILPDFIRHGVFTNFTYVIICYIVRYRRKVMMDNLRRSFPDKREKDALPIGNGLYLNGDFNQMQQYILSGAPTQGVVRFFMGYAGWQRGQLKQEIEQNTWVVSNQSKVDLLNMYLRDLWQETLCDLGGKYAIWSRYPKYPSMN